MSDHGWKVVDFAVVVVVGALIAVALLHGRGLLWRSHARSAQTVVKRLGEALTEYRQRYGHLPGDANRDGEIDAGETGRVAADLAQAGLVRGATQITAEIAGRTVVLRVIAREASAVPRAPRGRNVIELWGLPCEVARELDTATDDGNFSKGTVRASVASCVVGGANDPVPVVAVAIPR